MTLLNRSAAARGWLRRRFFEGWRGLDGDSSVQVGAAPALSVGADVILHHLRVFGYRGLSPMVFDRPLPADAARARAECAVGRPVIAVLPCEQFCGEFGVVSSAPSIPPPLTLIGIDTGERRPRRLRTLHSMSTYSCASGTPVVVESERREAAWLWLPCGQAGLLLIGTALPQDLIRYRQGDPALGATPDTRQAWGIAGERPMYLFDRQLDGEAPGERHADWWAMALSRALEDHGGLCFGPILPGGAPGAVVITGDDDQAYLEKYDEQLRELGDLPITYFLHPQTRHTRASMAQMFAGRRVDLGIHPDALDAPERYDELFAQQANWYRGLCDAPPLSVRNHGFLNHGYWGHLSAWLADGVRLSANLPGMDGRVLNDSLLPARIVWNGELTPLWSILTAIGDGVVFALGMSPDESANCIFELAANIRASGVAGIIVLNLHPQNIAEARAMHHAVRRVVESGFLAWTVRDCLDWFEAADRSGALAR